MGLPPIVTEGGITGFGGAPTPVRIGSPNDIVTVLLDILVLDGRAGWQRDNRFSPRHRQKIG